jgi:hypothetical protein
MQPVDIEEVKRVSARLGRQKLTQARMPLNSPTLTDRERAIHELLRSYLAKSGFGKDLAQPREQIADRRQKARCHRALARRPPASPTASSYELIKSGDLQTVRIAGRRYVVMASHERLITPAAE